MPVIEAKPQPATELDWPSHVPPPPRGDELPTDDGVPLETWRHRLAMNLLIDTLDDYWADRDDVCVAGNMFLYYSAHQKKHNDFRGPDVFVVTDTVRKERKSWVVWEEDGRLPDVVIELLSESTAAVDRGAKKRIYESVMRVPDYFLYDPFSYELEGYRLGPRGYEQLEANAAGRLPSAAVGLEIGVWRGVYANVEADWLRWYTTDGELLPTQAERTRIAEQERDATAERAQELEAKLAAYERRFGELGDDEG